MKAISIVGICFGSRTAFSIIRKGRGASAIELAAGEWHCVIASGKRKAPSPEAVTEHLRAILSPSVIMVAYTDYRSHAVRIEAVRAACIAAGIEPMAVAYDELQSAFTFNRDVCSLTIARAARKAGCTGSTRLEIVANAIAKIGLWRFIDAACDAYNHRDSNRAASAMPMRAPPQHL